MSDPNYESTLRFLKNNSWVEDDIPLVTEYVTQIINELYAIYEQCDVDGLKRFIYKDKYKKTPNQEANQDSDTSDDELSPHKKFLQIKGDARKYQTAMVELAKQRNTIVTLGTGQGKTLIAMMTIRHFRTKFPNKQTWFLVPTVALALQQADALKVNLPFQVGIAVHTAINSESARDLLHGVEILVATHGSALDLLRHYGDKFHLSRVNLLVLDECHNATKQHNYAVIMDKFFHTLSKDMRPHVLGLTASPIINIRKQVTDHALEELLGEIESKLDSRLISLSSLGIPPEESGVIEAMVEETVVYYQNNVVEIEDQLPNPFETGMHKERIREIDQLKYLFEELGPLVLHNYCQVLIKEISRNLFDEETPAQFDEFLQYLKAVIDHCKMIMDNKLVYVSKKLEELELLLIDLYKKPNSEHGSIGILFVERRITAVALKHYFSYLSCTDSSPESGHRSNVKLRCDMLTATTNNIFKYLHYHSHNPRAQKMAHEQWVHVMNDTRQVLTKLRNKELDILISTSLIEEGVDVAACSFVIVLDNLKTTKSYIQCKGRARNLMAKFMVFQDLNNPPPVTMEHARLVDTQVTTYIGNRLSSNPIPSAVAFEDDLQISSMQLEIQVLQAGEYRTDIAMVDLNSSKSVLNRYILAIPMDITARSSRRAMSSYLPVYETYSLMLPSHLPVSVRRINLPSGFRSENRFENEAKLALIACTRLHKLGSISDRLLPLNRNDMMNRILEDIGPSYPVRHSGKRWDTQSQVVDAHNAVIMMNRILDDIGPSYPVSLQAKDLKEDRHHMFDRSERLHTGFVYPISYQSESFQIYDSLLQSSQRTLGIFSYRELKSSSGYLLNHSQFGQVQCRILIGDRKKVSLDDSEWAICTSFYQVLFNARWSRRTGRKKFRFCTDEHKRNDPSPSYIVVSLTADGIIDCNRMQRVIKDFNRSDEERRLSTRNLNQDNPPRLWAPVYSPNTTYVAFGPQGSFCSERFPNESFINYVDYYQQTWSFTVDLDCPLIKAQQLWECSNSATNATKSVQIPRDVLLPLDAFIEAPLADASLFLHSTFLPQVLYFMERREIMHNFLEYCEINIKPLSDHLKKIPLDLVLEALTAKSCLLEMDYDRLEYLGDAVLKLIQTDSLLHSSNMKLKQWLKCLHEGDLSSLRSEMGCNDRLKCVSEINGIEPYILMRPLNRSEWYPSHLDLTENDVNGINLSLSSANHKYKPSDKVKADVIESLIGLIYLNTHNGFQSATLVAEAMGLAIVQDRTHDESTGKNRECILSDKLLQTVNDFLGIELKHSSLIKEAITHPTVLHSEVPSYQRLEWVGDAVLCLAAREWLYAQFPRKSVKELVPIEATMVSNEALAWLGCSAGINKHIEHCDSSFPGRFEEYTANIESCAIGIWGSRPPKVIADVVEALIGVAHTQGGVSLGQQCAQYILTPITSAILRNDKLDETSHYELMHPQQLIMQLCPAAKVRAIEEDGYSGNRLWLGPSIGWHDVHEGSYVGPVGHVTFYGVKLIAATDKSSRIIAKNRACSILANIFLQNPTLTATLGKLSYVLQENSKL